MDQNIIRKLAVGFDDSKTIRQRRLLINSNGNLNEISSPSFIQMAEKSAVWLDKNPDCGVWWNWDEGYPDFYPVENRVPFMIFYRGTKPEGRQKYASIVGTRHCDYEGLQKAFSLGLEFSANGYSVISGLAEGCDQAATWGGLAYSDTPSYAVLGCGLDIDYPKITSSVKNRIIDGGGAILSRFAPGTLPLKYNFPNRNVIVSAMSSVLVAVQAPLKSGTLITVDLALQMGKDVVVSSAGSGDTPCRLGTEKLIREGAPVIDSIDDYINASYIALPSDENEKGRIRFGSRFYTLKPKKYE